MQMQACFSASVIDLAALEDAVLLALFAAPAVGLDHSAERRNTVPGWLPV